MTVHRPHLPQLGGDLFLTDSGLETTLVFHHGIDLPCFAAFHLLREERGVRLLERYFRQHAGIALEHGAGFILESVTWRASADWGEKMGYGRADLERVNRQSIALLARLREALATERSPMVISGCLGPRGDGYVAGDLMTVEEAEAYHAEQIRVFADTEADQVTALTMTNAPEAAGVARAARAAGLPVVISFTVETDGRLPSGQPLAEAIQAVDEASAGAPSYYMINCAHPEHVAPALRGEAQVDRLRGIRANASRKSHAELEASTTLDDGDPTALGADCAELRHRHRRLNILGGCCGTDHRHLAAMAAALRRAAPASA